MLIDHFIMTLIIVVIAAPGFISAFTQIFATNHDPVSLQMGKIIPAFIVGFSIYFNKDLFNGQSPAKRILKLQVIDDMTGYPASPLKCLMRNCTMMFWPLEVLLLLKNPGKRLGDKIAGTSVVYTENPGKSAPNKPFVALSLVIAIAFFSLLFAPLWLLSPSSGIPSIPYQTESFQAKISEESSRLFETELNHLIREADIRVYDHIQNDDRKYVSAIMYFHNKEDFENFNISENEIATALQNHFPLNNNLCFVKFVYKQSGSTSIQQRLYESVVLP